MDWFVKAFLKSSVGWLAAGVTLGISMAVRPTLAVYRTAHMHMMLLGFVAMMIFGVAYHVIPRFAGHPLHSPRAAGIHWWMSNIGLVMMVMGFMVRARSGAVVTTLLSAGGIFSALGAYTFAYLLWRTLDGPHRLRAIRKEAGNRPGLPLA